jgi:hypothetical protein
MFPIMMQLYRNSDTSVAHWFDTVKVSQRTSWPAGGTGSLRVPTIYSACGTICNDVYCPNAVGGNRHIHRNHVKCRSACHGRRTWMRHSVPLRVCTLHLHRRAVQHPLVSRSGGSLPPHQCYKIFSRGRPLLSGGTCRSQVTS